MLSMGRRGDKATRRRCDAASGLLCERANLVYNIAASPRRRVASYTVLILLLFFDFTFAQSPLRLAIVELSGDERGEIAPLLRKLARDDRPSSLELIDTDLTRAAARGAGYTGSLNLSRDEARALGQSLGCNYYILGKILLTRRLGPADNFYFEALAGLFIVETRTGQLIRFVLERAQKQSEQAAYDQLKQLINDGWEGYLTAIISSQKSYINEIEWVQKKPVPVIEIIDDQSEEKGIKQPVFFQRLKPAYTEQAELFGITAVVELEASFSEDGEVGEIEIVRWAGFGLDESSISTLRLIKFKPAERKGKRLTIRALVRYNFKRPLSQATNPQAQSQEEIERLKQSLRGIRRLGQRPGQNPDF